MVVEGDSPREMSEGERLVNGDGGCGPPGCEEDDGGYDGGPPGCEGGEGGCDGRLGGCGEDDEIFLSSLECIHRSNFNVLIKFDM